MLAFLEMERDRWSNSMAQSNEQDNKPQLADDLPQGGRLRGTPPLNENWREGYDQAARQGEPVDAWPGWPDVTHGGGTAQLGYREADENGASYSAFTAGGSGMHEHWTHRGYDEQGGGY